MAEKSTVARPYAQAAFALAKEQGALSAWSDLLHLSAAVAAVGDVQALISSPRMSADQLAEFFIGVAGEMADEQGANFIRVLADNRRLAVLPEIAVQYEALKADEERTIRAHVSSAYELSAEQQATLVAALKKFLGRDVQLDCEVDQSLLGGAVIHAGDQVIDGSALGKLSRLSGQMEG